MAKVTIVKVVAEYSGMGLFLNGRFVTAGAGVPMAGGNLAKILGAEKQWVQFSPSRHWSWAEIGSVLRAEGGFAPAPGTIRVEYTIINPNQSQSEFERDIPAESKEEAFAALGDYCAARGETILSSRVVWQSLKEARADG